MDVVNTEKMSERVGKAKGPKEKSCWLERFAWSCVIRYNLENVKTYPRDYRRELLHTADHCIEGLCVFLPSSGQS